MAVKILENFINNKIRKGDLYVPSAIFLLLKNGGKATTSEIAKLLYIFENKHSLEKYEMIVNNMVLIILQEYSLVSVENDTVILNSWPIEKDDIEKLIKMCYKVANGFFRNLPIQQKETA